ncbi:hypothetical protein EH243_09285 [Amphritea opalescens]|uniref:Uncharacterized protein n=1 Tax=Amphritea opalescens TaxID=2490544 RepID=A0A430KR99_9GAMM|nr:hypothetical protein [Amphritea opalescens]RTE65874.1 hypothetical protein EH243_09285 [Amphritea opalescens]
MKRIIPTFALTLMTSLCFILPITAHAQALETCFVDSLTGKERKALVKWMFFSLSTHPELKAYSQVSAEDLQASKKEFGSLITRLMVEDCYNESKAALRTDPQAMQKAIARIVKLPINDLVSNTEVRATISDSAKLIDKAKIKQAFAP